MTSAPNVAVGLSHVQWDSNDTHSSCLPLASAIVARVLSAPWFDKATTISCYLSMPAGEVDTSAIATAILHSGMQLARGSTSTPPFFSCQIRVFTIPNFFYYLRREEPVRAESGCCAAGGDGPPPDLRRRGPARAAERRLGHQGADVSVPRRAQDERSVPAAHSPPGQLSSGTSPPSKVWGSIARLRDSDTARVTTTVSSPPTRPSPPLARTQGPSSVSGPHATVISRRR